MLSRTALRSLVDAAKPPARLACLPTRAIFASFRPLRQQHQAHEPAAVDAAPSVTPEPAKLQIRPRLRMTFTCTAPIAQPVAVEDAIDGAASSGFAPCGHRSTHEFSRHSYEKGIVIVQCPSCSVRHLIADHLDWFDSADLTRGGKLRTVEDLMREKGETVRRGAITGEGETIEYVEHASPSALPSSS